MLCLSKTYCLRSVNKGSEKERESDTEVNRKGEMYKKKWIEK